MINIKDNKLYKAFAEQFPITLRNDKDFFAFAIVFAKQLQKVIEETNRNLIYYNIDLLDENTLDMLAVDFKVDWYNTADSIEVKRNLIKDCLKVHKYKGTVYAVQTALSNLHKYSTVEEWFRYGGTHHFFRIVQDTTQAYDELDYKGVVRIVNTFKRLSAHLEEIMYQCSVGCVISIQADWFKYNIPITGTKPYRNILYSQDNKEIKAETEKDFYKYNVLLAGKKLTGEEPVRNTKNAVDNSGLKELSEVNKFSYTLKLCGSTRRL